MIKSSIKKIFGLHNYKKMEPDSFLKRLRSSVIGEGMLHPGNEYLIDYAIQNMPDEGSVLEIGTYGGLSTNLILYLLKKHNKKNKLFTCDPWVYEGYEDHKGIISEYIDGRNDITREAYMNYIKDSFIKSTRFLSADNLPVTCRNTSDEFFKSWERKEIIDDVFGSKAELGGGIAFCYIDGNHAYEYVKRDFENVSKYLINGGFVLLDDSADYLHFGSVEIIKEIKKNEFFKIVFKNPNYLFTKI